MSFFNQFPKITYDFASDGIDTKIIDIFRYIKPSDISLDDISLYQFYQIQSGDRPDIVSQQLYGTPEYYWTFFIINEQLKTGLSGWPMSTEVFEDYIDLEYSGIVLETTPSITIDPDGLVTGQPGSLAGLFSIGETVTGVTSGATGTVAFRDVQQCQLVLRNVSGTFLQENVRGQTRPGTQANQSASYDIITVAAVSEYRNAAHHFVNGAGLISYKSAHINEGSRHGIQIGTANPDLTAVSNYEYETELNDARANLRVIRPESIRNFAKTYRDLLNA